MGFRFITIGMAIGMALVLLACNSDGPDDSNDAGLPLPTACPEAEARLGHSVCVHRVPDEAVWQTITVPNSQVDQVRSTKYMMPAREDALLPTLFMDVNEYQLHFVFMADAFPDFFSSLTTIEYEQMILHPTEREFFAGMII